MICFGIQFPQKLVAAKALDAAVPLAFRTIAFRIFAGETVGHYTSKWPKQKAAMRLLTIDSEVAYNKLKLIRDSRKGLSQ
jgi:hypothetical protein